MPSCHHVGFQQCPFQVNMMIVQGLVDSSKNLKTGGLNVDLCSNLTSTCCGKTVHSLGVWEDKIEFHFLMKFITGVAALETPLLLRWPGYHSSYLLNLSLQAEVLKNWSVVLVPVHLFKIENAYIGGLSGNPKAWILLPLSLLTMSNSFLWCSYEVLFWSKLLEICEHKLHKISYWSVKGRNLLPFLWHTDSVGDHGLHQARFPAPQWAPSHAKERKTGKSLGVWKKNCSCLPWLW